ncbi:hypothetical protein [Cryptosporidium parvum Iowa II]|uniref:Uncharacterized protein n=1 Tax=Cryptosporidium parvum (strain Iowa II) TaxID=353152 RepID=Q5CPH9_CRYPI|nr:hypothetical protein [Cryptosporidium parvum Iowa II]EAK87354.1 hypothetical protein cgd6_340 [Cryptosporidium parvum Iowa II]
MNTNFCAGNCNSNIISIIVPGRNPETVINEGNGIVSTIVQNPQTVSNVVVAANGEVFTGDSGGKYFLFYFFVIKNYIYKIYLFIYSWSIFQFLSISILGISWCTYKFKKK